jgi:hypothetical protein
MATAPSLWAWPSAGRLLAPLDGHADFREDIRRGLQRAAADIEGNVLFTPDIGGHGFLPALVCVCRADLPHCQPRQDYHRREFHKPFASAEGGGKRP